MPRGDSLKRFNESKRLHKEELATAALEAVATAANAATAEVPLDDAIPVVETPGPDPGWAPEEMSAERQAMQERIEALTAEITAMKAGGIQPNFPTARPIISKPLPENYVVWLGPDPTQEDPDGGFRMSAPGQVWKKPSDDEFEAIDGDGQGKLKKVRRTTASKIILGFIKTGREDIHFQYRCPPNHRYAGKLYAPVFHPRHGAWMQLTMGMDRDRNPRFAWYLTTQFRYEFDMLRKSHMRRQSEVDAAVVELVESGAPMPSNADSHAPFQV